MCVKVSFEGVFPLREYIHWYFGKQQIFKLEELSYHFYCTMDFL